MPNRIWPAAANDEDFGPYLEGMPQESIDLFWRFVSLVRACGPVTFELQRVGIVLRGQRRIFASVGIGKDGLNGHINLTRQLPVNGRIHKIDPLTKRLFFHKYTVRCQRDLDEEFQRWLCEAREIGDGAHMAW
jgi:hypothetical protein